MVYVALQVLLCPAYSKADDVFHFESNGYETNGYTIELIMQENGNLQTENIDKGQF